MIDEQTGAARWCQHRKEEVLCVCATNKWRKFFTLREYINNGAFLISSYSDSYIYDGDQVILYFFHDQIIFQSTRIFIYLKLRKFKNVKQN